MKAICVTPSRELEVREVPTPNEASPGHVLIDMDGSAINPGDKAFLRMPTSAGNALQNGRHDVWGASGAGTVVGLGDGVPAHYMGKRVAIYRSLARTPEMIGLWCERAHMPYSSCVILPDDVRARDYCGSLVNVMTAYAFLEEIVEAGHKGVIVTAGNSATGHALAALAKARDFPAIFLVRTEAAKATLDKLGAQHVIVTQGVFTDALAKLSAELETTAVFEGVGGDFPGRIAPSLPMNSTLYLYGFLAGPEPFSIPSALVMMKNLTIRRFSNFASDTVSEPERRIAALEALAGVIGGPAFETRPGKEFRFEEIDAAMAYESSHGAKAILVP